MEHKDTFGFRSNPFVYAKHKAQLHRYVKTFGEGMVVYKLGHERDLFEIEGLHVSRDAKVFEYVNAFGRKNDQIKDGLSRR
jgi:hypothetical protein